jgi:hypothetical protein
MSGLDPMNDRHPGWDLALRLGLGARGEAVVRFLDDRQARKMKRAGSTYSVAAAAAGQSEEELFELIGNGDERLGDMFEETLEAATKTPWEAKLEVLGRALAMAVTAEDDAEIDHAQLLQRAVADLEPIHARALWLLGQRDKLNPGQPDGIEGLLSKVFPNMAPVASQVVAVLTRHGLVSEPFYANGVIGLSPLGREILQLLVEAGGLDVALVGESPEVNE